MDVRKVILEYIKDEIRRGFDIYRITIDHHEGLDSFYYMDIEDGNNVLLSIDIFCDGKMIITADPIRIVMPGTKTLEEVDQVLSIDNINDPEYDPVTTVYTVKAWIEKCISYTSDPNVSTDKLRGESPLGRGLRYSIEAQNGR